MDTLAVLTRQEAYKAINDPQSGSSTSAEHDVEVVDIWVPAVSRRIDDLCGPVVVRTVADERHDGGRTRIWLDHGPVFSVTSLVEYLSGESTTLTAEEDATLPDDGYLIDGDAVLRRSSGSDVAFVAGRKNVKITYEAGRYADTASVDAKFKMAAAAILRRLWSREAGAWARGGDPFVEAGAGTVGFFKAVDPMVAEFLSDEMRAPAVA